VISLIWDYLVGIILIWVQEKVEDDSFFE
jgi:hypothetical protein